MCAFVSVSVFEIDCLPELSTATQSQTPLLNHFVCYFTVVVSITVLFYRVGAPLCASYCYRGSEKDK